MFQEMAKKLGQWISMKGRNTNPELLRVSLKVTSTQSAPDLPIIYFIAGGKTGEGEMKCKKTSSQTGMDTNNVILRSTLASQDRRTEPKTETTNFVGVQWPNTTASSET
jgi:hypothetical protein